MILESLTLDKMLAIVKDAHTAKRRKLDATVANLTRLVALYAQTAEADIVRELAHSMNIEVREDLREPKAVKIAEELWGVLETLPELGGLYGLDPEELSPDIEEPGGSGDAEATPLAHYPTLADVTAKYPAILFGGETLGERIDWMKSHGVTATWYAVPGSTGSMRDTVKAVRAVQSHSVGFVLLAHRFVSHKAANQIKEAARKANIPIVTVGKAGNGQLAAALNTLEVRYAAMREKAMG